MGQERECITTKRRPFAAIRFNFVSQWRKSQLGVGTRAEREEEKQIFVQDKNALQENPADVNARSSITEIARLIAGISARRVVVTLFNEAYDRWEWNAHKITAAENSSGLSQGRRIIPAFARRTEENDFLEHNSRFLPVRDLNWKVQV
jgi:hypothetical protein